MAPPAADPATVTWRRPMQLMRIGPCGTERLIIRVDDMELGIDGLRVRRRRVVPAR